MSGSDLVIATIGAGLRAFTRHSKVELANGEDVPVETFLDEAQSRVLNAILSKVYGLADGVGRDRPQDALLRDLALLFRLRGGPV